MTYNSYITFGAMLEGCVNHIRSTTGLLDHKVGDQGVKLGAIIDGALNELKQKQTRSGLVWDTPIAPSAASAEAAIFLEAIKQHCPDQKSPACIGELRTIITKYIQETHDAISIARPSATETLLTFAL